MHMPVVVGKTYRRTPVFSDRIRYLVLNPYWEVPSSIARRDILKLVKKDPEYLSRSKFRIYDGWGADPREIDPKTVDWKNIDAKTLKFRFRQDPGPQNALGQAKFMFPNKFNVYIHGTPKKKLFIEKVRAFSSGCIRCEHPLELAEYLLRGVSGWDRQAIEAAIASGKDKTVSLPEPVPVHIFYCTSWTDEDGTINFRNDIYGRDAKLEAAFYTAPPSTQ
jgi:murein L,D-transpeptidase YcbB/YkuD